MKKICILYFFLIVNTNLFSQKIRVAIAANIQSVMKDLQEDFKNKTGIVVETIVGASGNLATQIRNGAPYDLFLSADIATPESLVKSGLCAKPVQIYAQGRLIVCSNSIRSLRNWKSLILQDSIKKIALANPEIAPYGKAALECLKKEELWDKIKDKIVQGESITQVNTYIANGLVKLGFTAKSFVMDPNRRLSLYWEPINPKNYSAIEQGMVLLKPAQGKPSPEADKFFQYILSPSAKTLFKRYGYSEN